MSRLTLPALVGVGAPGVPRFVSIRFASISSRDVPRFNMLVRPRGAASVFVLLSLVVCLLWSKQFQRACLPGTQQGQTSGLISSLRNLLSESSNQREPTLCRDLPGGTGAPPYWQHWFSVSFRPDNAEVAGLDAKGGDGPLTALHASYVSRVFCCIFLLSVFKFLCA